MQETRLWDETQGKTFPMRTKEEAHDYRYFPEPDLVPFEVDKAWIQSISEKMPELPKAKQKRFQSDYGLSEYDAGVLLQNEGLASLFEALAKKYHQYKNLANWLLGPVSAALHEKGLEAEELKLPHEGFIALLRLVDDGNISFKAAKEDVFPEFLKTGGSPAAIVEKKGLAQISDAAALETIVDDVVRKNPKSAEDYKGGKKNALMFLVGQVMRATKGKANPNLVNEMLEKKLK